MKPETLRSIWTNQWNNATGMDTWRGNTPPVQRSGLILKVFEDVEKTSDRIVFGGYCGHRCSVDHASPGFNPAGHVRPGHPSLGGDVLDVRGCSGLYHCHGDVHIMGPVSMCSLQNGVCDVFRPDLVASPRCDGHGSGRVEKRSAPADLPAGHANIPGHLQRPGPGHDQRRNRHRSAGSQHDGQGGHRGSDQYGDQRCNGLSTKESRGRRAVRRHVSRLRIDGSHVYQRVLYRLHDAGTAAPRYPEPVYLDLVVYGQPCLVRGCADPHVYRHPVLLHAQREGFTSPGLRSQTVGGSRPDAAQRKNYRSSPDHGPPVLDDRSAPRHPCHRNRPVGASRPADMQGF